MRKEIRSILVNYKFAIVFIVLFSIIVASLNLSVNVFTQYLIDKIIPQRDRRQLLYAGMILLGLLCAKILIAYCKKNIVVRTSKRINLDIVAAFLQKVIKQPVLFFIKTKVGDLTARVNKVSAIENGYITITDSALPDFLSVASALIAIFIYSKFVALICIVFIPLYFLLFSTFRELVLKKQKDCVLYYGQSEASFITMFSGMPTIKLYRSEKFMTDRSFSVYDDYQASVQSIRKFESYLNLVANITASLFLVIVLFWTAYQCISLQMTTGVMVAIVGLSSSLLPSVASLSMLMVPLAESAASLDRIFDDDQYTETDESDIDLPVFSRLSVSKLDFGFHANKLLLKDISFEIRKGQLAAITGKNGSGKTTFLEILTKTYLPLQGDVQLNGETDFFGVSDISWYKIMAYVPQAVFVFNGTIIENIAFMDAHDRAKQVYAFLEKENFISYFSNLENGIYTEVGDGKVRLSGGQKQVLGLARALYHNPQLLILDETSASMDDVSDRFLVEKLLELKKRLAIIYVTHKKHNLRDFADKVYEITDGKMKEIAHK